MTSRRSCAVVCEKESDCQIRVFMVVVAELPALAPGARCRVGRSVGSGAPEADLWKSAV